MVTRQDLEGTLSNIAYEKVLETLPRGTVIVFVVHFPSPDNSRFHVRSRGSVQKLPGVLNRIAKDIANSLELQPSLDKRDD